jgi:spermidine synthase
MYGLDTAVYIASIINFMLAAFIYSCRFLAHGTDTESHTGESGHIVSSDRVLGKYAYLLVFIAGFLAIGYEIVCFRIIHILVKGSSYSLSSSLGTFLTGIAMGSFGISLYMKRKRDNMVDTYFGLQYLTGLYILVAFILYYYLTRYTSFGVLTRLSFRNQLHPRFFPPEALISMISSPGSLVLALYNMLDVFFWPMLFVFIPTIFMGAGFPLISFLALRNPDREGATIGMIYFFNILGNVMGGIFTGFFLLQYSSTETTLLVFAVTGLLFGLFYGRTGKRRSAYLYRYVGIFVLILSGTVLFPGSGELYLAMHPDYGNNFKTYFEEGLDGVVATFVKDNAVRNFINGLPQGGKPHYYFYYNAIEAIRYARNLDDVLIIGYGAGTGAEIVQRMSSLKKLTVVEISTSLIKNLLKIPMYEHLLSDDKLRLVPDDGRRFLYRTDTTYDLVLMDPLYTTTAYSNNIYSYDFFNLVSSHLKENGIFMVWTDEHRVVPKTLTSVFPHVLKYSYFLLASKSRFELNTSHIECLNKALTPREQLGLSGFIGNSFEGDTAYIASMTLDYPINRDLKPVCEYFLGLKLSLEHHLTIPELNFP